MSVSLVKSFSELILFGSDKICSSFDFSLFKCSPFFLNQINYGSKNFILKLIILPESQIVSSQTLFFIVCKFL
jgi:hypothetical protein